MKKHLILAFGLFVFAAVSLVGGVSFSRSSVSDTAAVKAENLKTGTFAVENMTCGTCPITVKKAMSRVEGVKSVVVDFDKKTATVTYDPAVTTPEAIAAASTNAGYPARPAS